MSNVGANRKLPVGDIVNTLASSHRDFTVNDVAAHTGTSRQAVHRQLAALVRAGVLATRGKGRATRYHLAETARAPAPAPEATFTRTYPTAGLAEDAVWKEVAARLAPLRAPAHKSAHDLFGYALTEMVNNAIDHSRAAEVTVRAGAGPGSAAAPRESDVFFEVSDPGVGAFENVRAALRLPDHLAALQEITKGKRSTQPDRHSGEGLFFTSKVADHFELEANGLVWLVDNRRHDEAIGTAPPHPGTTVRFGVALDKAERLEEVFARYTHGFEFDTTRTVVKLFQYGVRFVSRSEAKRLVEGLERFAHVLIDFAGVEAVGQGFADEVFRVWARNHPTISLTPTNMSPAVAFMVERARAHPR